MCAAFERHGELLGVIQEDLFAALSVAACAPSLACLSGACQVLPGPTNLEPAPLNPEPYSTAQTIGAGTFWLPNIHKI